MRQFEYETPTKLKPPEKTQVSETKPVNPPTQITDPTRDPYRRPCEFEPGYNWRTDPYYSEEAIRTRMKAAKTEHLAKHR